MAKSRIKKILIVLLNIVLYLIYGNNIIYILIASIGAYFLGKMLQKIKKTIDFRTVEEGVWIYIRYAGITP